MSHAILNQIGRTPLLPLSFADSAPGARIWAKLESANPGGSIKDRIALGMIEQAEQQGLLTPGARLIEPTSGNTGIGLALVCAVRGYHLTLTMPDNMSLERRRLLQAYGAELLLTPAEGGMTAAIDQAERLESQGQGLVLRQFSNPANPATHERTTGPEIQMAIAAQGGQVDAFVAAVGTGGTLTGVGRFLRRHHPGVQLFAVEPEGSAVLSGHHAGRHAIQGIGAGFIPPVLDPRLYDAVLTVSDDEAMACCRSLTRLGIGVGISSGANVVAARRVARELRPDQHVVTILCDGCERYLSTGIFD
ncbi:MAG: cysteine synthase A [Desulfuromonadaceae bacterium]|nr:cysteine synthase A [Desulfuromonadaceae bacterium]